jgi:hypothetical protein
MWHLRNQPLGDTSLFRLSEGRGGREILMRSEEAQIGKRVRVRTDYRKTNLRGQEGTIARDGETLPSSEGVVDRKE